MPPPVSPRATPRRRSRAKVDGRTASWSTSQAYRCRCASGDISGVISHARHAARRHEVGVNAFQVAEFGNASRLGRMKPSSRQVESTTLPSSTTPGGTRKSNPGQGRIRTHSGSRRKPAGSEGTTPRKMTGAIHFIRKQRQSEMWRPEKSHGASVELSPRNATRVIAGEAALASGICVEVTANNSKKTNCGAS